MRIIYCNGDSFVNGHELGDDLLSDHPGYYDFSTSVYDAKKYTDWYSNTFDPTHKLGQERKNKSEDIFAKQVQVAFPNIIHEKTGIPVINKAVRYLGNSQESITRNSITDLYFLRKQHKNITAIVSLTSINRITLPKPENSWNVFMLTNLPNPDSEYNKGLGDIFNFYMNFSTDYHLLLDWYKNVILLQNFCKLNDIRLLLTTGFPPYDKGGYEDVNDIEAYRKIANIQFDVDLQKVAQEIDTGVWCPGYHFSPKVHERAADLFIEIINKQN